MLKGAAHDYNWKLAAVLVFLACLVPAAVSSCAYTTVNLDAIPGNESFLGGFKLRVWGIRKWASFPFGDLNGNGFSDFMTMTKQWSPEVYLARRCLTRAHTAPR
eukprot:gb/GECG01000548.1/.p1 GENE.gb/GECG01000548.1/~~gb/GECG01000548.1/.p1  ORF type:complete len:104 (+),score=2.94 gb/GECG01000548.1/:1-312(+)